MISTAGCRQRSNGKANSVNQGVRQGAILSPHLYKMYVNPLLVELQRSALGAHIGSIYTGTLAVADDFLLLSNCPEELQIMLNLKDSYSGERRYKVHPIKTTLVSRISTSSSRGKDSERKWYIGNTEISHKSETEHLGLIRSVKDENKLNLQKRISLARRTLYSLIKSGLHGCNGLNPKISYKIYQVYVLPRLLYGLEVLSLNKKQIDELEKFHLDILKNIQSLPVRTANSIVYLLLGALPLKAELERKQLGLFYSTIKSENSTLQHVLQRQLVLQNEGSFFRLASEAIERYDLPPIEELQKLSKDQWKSVTKKAVREYWTSQLQEEAASKSTLNHCHVMVLRMGLTHPIWDSVQSNRMDVMRAIIKVRMVTGTYLLQTHRCKFKMDGITDATCPLCRLEEEDIVHMLTRCPALAQVRCQYITGLKQCFQDALGPRSWSDNIRDDITLVQLILDCQKLIPTIIPDDSRLVDIIETQTRLLCYKLHMKRLFLYDNIKGVPGTNMAANPTFNQISD